MASAEHACNTHIGVATHGTQKRKTGAAAPTEHARDAPERARPRVGAQQGACARHEEVSATDRHGAQKIVCTRKRKTLQCGVVVLQSPPFHVRFPAAALPPLRPST